MVLQALLLSYDLISEKPRPYFHSCGNTVIVYVTDLLHSVLFFKPPIFFKQPFR